MAQEPNQDQKQFHELAAGFDTAMLVTQQPDGVVHARPMAGAGLRPDGTTYFSTALDSPKIDELAANDEVLVTFQAEQQFATLRGKITVSKDFALIERLWQPDWEVWFPRGKTDPNLCILVLAARDGEFWDQRGGDAIGYRFVDVKHPVLEDSEVPEENHARVRFNRRN